MITVLIAASLLLTATAPFAILGLGGDTTNAALVAGIFSVVNTILNARLLRRVADVASQVKATKKAGREGVKALTDLADQKRSPEAPS
jgi:hypothetical protein